MKKNIVFILVAIMSLVVNGWAQNKTEQKSALSEDRNLYVRYFQSAADEFGIPVDILKGISFAETRWSHLTWAAGDTASCMGMPHPYGIMSLWDNDFFGHSLKDAARLIGKDVQALKDDPLQNIRGAAALLKKLYDSNPIPEETTRGEIESWRNAIAIYSGLTRKDFAQQHALDIYAAMNLGYHQYGIEWNQRTVKLDVIKTSVNRIIKEEEIKERNLHKVQDITNQPDYPSAKWVPSYPDHWYKSGYTRSFVVVHDMEGYYLSTINYFQQQYQGTPPNTASIYYCINSGYRNNGRPAGEVTQMVEEKYWAWHARCWNEYMFGIEHEGFASNPAWYTQEMYYSSAQLVKYLCNKYAIPKDRNHIIGHNQWQTSSWVNWVNSTGQGFSPTCNTHTDPGPNWDWTGFMNLVIGTTPQATATITNISVSPTITSQGSTVSLTYTINATGNLSVLLGASIKISSSATWDVSDPNNDISVSLVSGTQQKTRSFYIPFPLASGTYDLLVALWSDNNGNNKIDGLTDTRLDQIQKNNAFTIGSIPTPTIMLNKSSLSFGNQKVNTTSSSQYYTVSGSNLTSSITISVPGGFQVSQNNSTWQTTSITLNPSGGAVQNTSIYVRFYPTAVQSYSGLYITHVSSGATPQYVEVSGNGTGDSGLKPTIVNQAISNITSTSAHVDAVINPNGNTAEVYFEYGTNNNYGSSSATSSLGAGTTGQTVGTTFTGLLSNTLYYYRVVATNAFGTSMTDATFKTLPSSQVPTVTTTATTNITQTSAQLNAIVNPNGLSTEYYFHGGPETGILEDTRLQNAGSGTSEIAVNLLLTGLTPNTAYGYYAVAKNSAGTSSNTDLFRFTTLASITPTITTSPVSNITGTTAISGGNITSDGGASVTTRGVCWSTSSDPTTANAHTSDGTGTGLFTSNISGLSPGTQYHYRAYATNSVGTSYGSEVIFTTSSSIPTITVTSPTSGTVWNVGSTANVNWTSTGSISNVNIKLSTDAGNSFPITLASSTQNDGAETISVPNNPSITCRIKVESSADPSIFGISSDNFPIHQQTGTDFWQQRSTPYNVTIYSLAINSGGSIYVGANNRIYSSSDDGITWSLLNQNMTSYLIRTLYIPQDGQIFAGTGGDGIYLSTNNGSNWTQMNSGIGLSYINSFISTSNGNIFAGAYGLGIYHSTDSGNNWIQSNTGLSSNKINVLAISNSGNIFAGTDGGGMFRSTDAGNTWVTINNGLNNKSVYSVGIASTGNIFVGTDVGNIYRSTDNGDNWSLVNVGMTSSTIISLAINSDGYVYAGTWGSGVFVSKDNGNSWSQVNSGLSDKNVSSLVIDKNDYLIAGTKNGNVFRSIKTKETTCYTLLTNISPNGSGNISINTPQNCSGGYSPNTQINLTASPTSGYNFSGWSVATGGSFSNSSSTPTTFTITGNATVTANFTPVSNPVITVSVTSLPDFNVQKINTISDAKSYTITGDNLTENLVIQAPNGFEISTSQTSNFGNGLTLIPLNGVITSRTIWVRFVPTLAQVYSGYISNVSGTANQKVNVSGTGTNSCDPGWALNPYTNSTTAYGIVTINGAPAANGDKVGAFVSRECRGIGTVIVNQGNAYVTLNIQGDNVETVGFKIFHVSECKSYEVGYTTSTNPGNTIGNPPNYLPIASSTSVTQNINLKTGWNFISFYVHPQDMKPSNVFGSILSSLTQVKNLSQSYDPNVPNFLNTLTSLQDGYGYLVKLKSSASLSISGSLVGTLSIPLTTGWNLIGHPKQNALPVTTIFSSIMSSIVQIKSVDKSYDPSVPDFLNTLTQMEPGQGYFIKMKNSSTINYSVMPQSNTAEINSNDFAKEGNRVVAYTNSTTVYGELSYNGMEEIKTVKAMVNEECRAIGNVVEVENKYYVTLVVNGETDEPVEFSLYGVGNKLLGKAVDKLITKPGEILYHKILFMDGNEDNVKKNDELTVNKLYPVYPNPFNPTTIITFELVESSPVDLTIYNINGQIVKRMLSQNLSNGHYTYQWDGKNDDGGKCSSGIYFLRMITKHTTNSQKLLLIK